jgi:hypothetical protein
MAAKKCPVCGVPKLLEKHGEFRMELPANVPGNAVLVPNSSWWHCDSCGEDILSLELERAINGQIRPRRVPSVG